MIFAHGPLGFLTAIVVRRRAMRAPFSFTTRQWYLLLFIGYVGGIFPDVDLLYFYLADASTPHRALLTHTPLVYLVLFALFGGWWWLRKRYTWFLCNLVFVIGVMSHLITDAIVSKVMFLYPFSTRFFGISDFGISWVSANLLFLNFLFEGVVFFAFFYTLIRWWVHHIVWRIAALSLLLCVFTAGVATLIIGNGHVYHTTHESRYSDADRDHTPNFADRDMDGDGIANIDDSDADGDGKSNPHEVIENSENFFGVLYDPTEGGLAQIPARLGLLTNHDVVWRLYESFGVYIETEMAEDYAQQPADYATSPADAQFDRRPENIAAWLMHTNRLDEHPESSEYKIGDILFFDDGYLSVVTGFTTASEPLALDLHPGRTVNEKKVEALTALQGPVRARGHVLDSAPLYAE